MSPNSAVQMDEEQVLRAKIHHRDAEYPEIFLFKTLPLCVLSASPVCIRKFAQAKQIFWLFPWLLLIAWLMLSSLAAGNSETLLNELNRESSVEREKKLIEGEEGRRRRYLFERKRHPPPEIRSGVCQALSFS